MTSPLLKFTLSDDLLAGLHHRKVILNQSTPKKVKIKINHKGRYRGYLSIIPGTEYVTRVYSMNKATLFNLIQHKPNIYFIQFANGIHKGYYLDFNALDGQVVVNKYIFKSTTWTLVQGKLLATWTPNALCLPHRPEINSTLYASATLRSFKVKFVVVD